MEKDKFDELQSKISGIEAELEKAKLELEASNKEATIEEIRSYFSKAKEIKASKTIHLEPSYSVPTSIPIILLLLF